MGSIGANKGTATTMSLNQIYNKYNLNDDQAVRQAFREGKITRDEYNAKVSEMREGADIIVNRMVDNFTETTIKALMSTMDRKLALTSDSDITGSLEFYKTDNGYVLNAPSTRSNFRAFMNNEGEVTRMPANELKTAKRINLSGSTVYNLSRRFEDIRRRRNS